MSRQRKSGNTSCAGETRLSALLKGSKSAQIKDVAWDFSRCPHPEQTEACFLYEYSLASESVREEVVMARQAELLRSANKEHDDEWFRENPPPEGSDELAAWCKRAEQEIPYSLPITRLACDLRFLTQCTHFPQKHWLEIPPLQRKEIASRFDPDRDHWGLEDRHMAKQRMLILPLRDFRESLWLRWPSMTAQPSEKSSEFVFSLYWARSDRLLLSDLKRWLKENRPEEQPALEHTASSMSRKTSPKDLLRVLAALRLLDAFEGNYNEARFHSLEVSGQALYEDQAAWIKAKRKAQVAIEQFSVTKLAT